MRHIKLFFTMITLAVFSAALFAGCGEAQEKKMPEEEVPELITYEATAISLNSDVNDGMNAGAEFTIKQRGDTLKIHGLVDGVARGMSHLQHLHGFKDGTDAVCPDKDEADKNGDGIIDLLELREYSGITMIPLHGDPVNLEIKSDTYPTAGPNGEYQYESEILLSDLQKAVKEKFGIEELDLTKFVIYIHGVENGDNLPESVQSLEGVPASVTLPVACAPIERE